MTRAPTVIWSMRSSLTLALAYACSWSRPPTATFAATGIWTKFILPDPIGASSASSGQEVPQVEALFTKSRGI